MADLREELYARYLTAFKGDPRNVVNVPRFWSWCDFKFKSWLTDLPRTASILELGCGPGYLLGYLKQMGFTTVDGIDLSEEQIAIARELGHRAEVADVFEYLDQRAGQYDAILAFDFIEHFQKQELHRLTGAIAASLKPGGRLILQTPNGQGIMAGYIIYGDLTHGTIFTPGSLQQMLGLLGFNQFEFREAGPAPSDLRGILRVAAWRVLRVGLNVISKIANGRTQSIWTDNMLCMCRSSERRELS
jgi:2-polyprenyl-3-methyl-5-hydroxy-6-metoxy-1,4-benzoquinol methylase